MTIDPFYDDTPAPGSDAALKQGCQCPVLDNGHGRGREIDGHTYYWIMQSCPLHGQGRTVVTLEGQLEPGGTLLDSLFDPDMGSSPT